MGCEKLSSETSALRKPTSGYAVMAKLRTGPGTKNCSFATIHSQRNLTKMIDTWLVAENTVVSAKGDGPSVDVSPAANRVFLLTLDITKIIEQESLDVSILGSADGATWNPKPVAAFAQKFYCSQSPLLLDLIPHPDVRFVRAHWEAARWGRGTETPMFEFSVKIKEVPADILREATAEAKALA